MTAPRAEGNEQFIRDFSGELLVLLAVPILLFSRRLHAVIDRDRDRDEVGVRGS